jgi:hypothetical protein
VSSAASPWRVEASRAGVKSAPAVVPYGLTDSATVFARVRPAGGEYLIVGRPPALVWGRRAASRMLGVLAHFAVGTALSKVLANASSGMSWAQGPVSRLGGSLTPIVGVATLALELWPAADTRRVELMVLPA